MLTARVGRTVTGTPPPTAAADRARSAPDRPRTSVRPLMYGYLRVHKLKAEPADVASVFNEYARRQGFSLAEVFIEQDSTTPAAFGRLIEAVKHRSAGAIAVPTIDHLAVLGSAPLGEMLQRLTGAKLHEMDRVPGPPLA
jgi:hypothetical protein